MKIALYVLLFLLILGFVNGFLFRRGGRRISLKIRRNNIFGRLLRRQKPKNSLQNIVRNAADKLKDLVKPLRKKSVNGKKETRRRGKSRRVEYTDLGSSPVSPDDILTVGAPRELHQDVREKSPADYSHTPKHAAGLQGEPGYIKPPIVPEDRPGDYSRPSKPSVPVDLISPEAYVDPQSTVDKSPQDYARKPDIVANPTIPREPALPIIVSDKIPGDYSGRPAADTVLPDTYVDTQGSVDIISETSPGFETPVITAKRPRDYSQQPDVDPILPEAYIDPQNSARGAGYDSPKVVNPVLTDATGGYVESIPTKKGYSADVIADPSVQDTIKRPGDYGQKPVVDPIIPEAYVDPQNSAGGGGIDLPASPELRTADYGRRPDTTVNSEISVGPILTDTSGSSGYSASAVPSNTRDGYVEPPGTNNGHATDIVPNLLDPDPVQGHTSDATSPTGPEVLEVIEDPVFHGMNRRIFQQGGENFQGVACQIGGCKEGLHCVVVNTGNVLDTCLEGSWDLCKCIKGCVVSKGIHTEGRLRGKCRGCSCRAGEITCRSGRVCSM